MNRVSINVGDIIFQLVYFVFLAFIIIFILAYFRSKKKHRNRLDRIEKEVNNLTEEIQELKNK